MYKSFTNACITNLKKLFGFVCIALSAIALNAQSPTPNEVFKTAFAAHQLGNYDLAIKNFSLAISIDPARNYFYYNRGMTYKAMGNNEFALKDFQRSNELKQTAESFYQIGIIKYIKGDLDGARVEFENAKLIYSQISQTKELNVFQSLMTSAECEKTLKNFINVSFKLNMSSKIGGGRGRNVMFGRVFFNVHILIYIHNII